MWPLRTGARYACCICQERRGRQIPGPENGRDLVGQGPRAWLDQGREEPRQIPDSRLSLGVGVQATVKSQRPSTAAGHATAHIVPR